MQFQSVSYGAGLTYGSDFFTSKATIYSEGMKVSFPMVPPCNIFIMNKGFQMIS